jgi:hypothetical protein
MDRLERIAFNSLPAALWEDVTANVYHHASNQLSCGGQYGYNLFYCCSANVHQGKWCGQALGLLPCASWYSAPTPGFGWGGGVCGVDYCGEIATELLF